jgi:hypothetical protein
MKAKTTPANTTGRTDELIFVISSQKARRRPQTAKSLHVCKICGKPANSFRSARAALEYNISSICQWCKDYFIPD